jgi:hypothetical protein
MESSDGGFWLCALEPRSRDAPYENGLTAVLNRVIIGKISTLRVATLQNSRECNKFASSSAMTAHAAPFHGHFMGETNSPSS